MQLNVFLFFSFRMLMKSFRLNVANKKKEDVIVMKRRYAANVHTRHIFSKVYMY